MNIWKGIAKLFGRFLGWMSKKLNGFRGKKIKNFQKKVISKHEAFKYLSKQTQNVIYRDFFEKWYLKGKSINWYLGYLKKRINYITKKLANGQELTYSQQKFYNEFKEMFKHITKNTTVTIENENGDRSSYINSSWIISATYYMKSRIMECRFVRSGKIYSFFAVPEWVFIHLATLPSGAGSWWWKEWLWKYSINKFKWRAT